MFLPLLLLSLQMPPGPMTPVQPLMAGRVDREPSLNSIIQRAKQRAAQLPSPPRIYGYEGPNVRGGSVGSWPDRPGSTQTGFNTCGNVPAGLSSEQIRKMCIVPITLTTEVVRQRGGNYRVTFRSQWQRDRTYRHRWVFEMDAWGPTKFVEEKGDSLPPMVQ